MGQHHTINTAALLAGASLRRSNRCTVLHVAQVAAKLLLGSAATLGSANEAAAAVLSLSGPVVANIKQVGARCCYWRSIEKGGSEQVDRESAVCCLLLPGPVIAPLLTFCPSLHPFAQEAKVMAALRHPNVSAALLPVLGALLLLPCACGRVALSPAHATCVPGKAWRVKRTRTLVTCETSPVCCPRLRPFTTPHLACPQLDCGKP